MKYREDTNINIISIGEKIEMYLLEYRGRFINEEDLEQIVTLYSDHFLDYNYLLDFEDSTALSISIALFNKREQDYIENTQDKIQFTIGRKVEEC